MRVVSTVMGVLLLAMLATSQFQPTTPPDWGAHESREDLATAGSLEGAQRVLRFVQVSDAHIIDDDAPEPLRVYSGDELFFGSGISDGAERPQEEFTDEVLDATIRSINEIHAADRLDFVINTGDNIDNELENELMRFIDNWEGTFTTVGPITQNQCAADGQSEGIDDHDNDVTDTCTHLPDMPNTPLAPGLPWFSAFGNHDGLIQGNVAPQPSFNDIAADSGRYFISQEEYVGMHFAAGTQCVDGKSAGSVFDDFGHGYGFAGERLCDEDSDNDGYYAFESRGVRFIVLDTINDDPATANENEPGALDPQDDLGYDIIGGLSEGAIDPVQYQWMLDEIDRFPDKAIVLFSHHTINSMFTQQYDKRCPQCPGEPFDDSGFVTHTQMLADLAERPHVVAWIGGHTHKHNIEPKSLEGAPSPGFWNVETSSLVDLPQQARVIELWVTADGAKGFFAMTRFGHDFDVSAELAATDPQFDAEEGNGEPIDQDVLLWFDIPEGVSLTPQASLPRFLQLNVLEPQLVNGSHARVGDEVDVVFEVRESLAQATVDGLNASIRITVDGEVIQQGSLTPLGDGQYATNFTAEQARVHYADVRLDDPTGLYPPLDRVVSIDVDDVASEKSGKKSPGPGILVLAAILLARRQNR